MTTMGYIAIAVCVACIAGIIALYVQDWRQSKRYEVIERRLSE